MYVAQAGPVHAIAGAAGSAHYNPMPANRDSRVSVSSLLTTDEAPYSTFVVKGLTYWQARSGFIYPLPIDDFEYERLDMTHTLIYETALDEHLHNAHFKTPPRRILDVGYGSGFWMSEMSMRYPQSQVLGIDMQRGPVPARPRANCIFQSPVDFTAPQWPIGPEPMDFIHMAQLCGSVGSWDSLYETAFQHLRPGTGQLEHIEIDWLPRSYQRLFPPQAEDLRQWWLRTEQASIEAGFPLTYREDTETLLARAGFMDISHRAVAIPLFLRQHRRDDPDSQLAQDYQMTMAHVGSQSFSSFSMALLTTQLGYTPEMVEQVCGRALDAARLRGLPLYMNLHVWTARRPMNHG